MNYTKKMNYVLKLLEDSGATIRSHRWDGVDHCFRIRLDQGMRVGVNGLTFWCTMEDKDNPDVTHLSRTMRKGSDLIDKMRSYGYKFKGDEPAKPSAHILWGECPADGQTPIEYGFDTEAELNAFLFGVDETVGWMGYRLVDADFVYDSDKDE